MNDVPRTHGLWAASSPPGPAAPPLAGEVVADVAIVGGGFTGCSAAYHLARAGQVPVLIEAERVGFGGAGRNVGLVNAGLWVMPNDLLTTLDAPYGERLLEQLGDAPRLVFDLIASLGIDCEIGRAHVRTPATNAQLVCLHLLEK